METKEAIRVMQPITITNLHAFCMRFMFGMSSHNKQIHTAP